MRLGMVWAEARGGAIGRDGEMPWHVPEDLAHFKRVTLGDPVIMGRRTWASLPERFRPLPGRTNIVVTADAQYPAEGATIVASLEAAIAAAEADGPEIAWVMGGGQMYRAAIARATDLVVTRLDLDIDAADTFAPEIGPEWQLIDAGEQLISATGVGYRFERFERF